MAKAKVATRKKGSKRRKASAKVERKSAARRAAAKKVKLKVRRAGGVARRSMTKRQRAPKVAATKVSRKPLNQVVEAPVEDTIIDVTEEPVPGVMDVTEDHTIATAELNSVGSVGTTFGGARRLSVPCPACQSPPDTTTSVTCAVMLRTARYDHSARTSGCEADEHCRLPRCDGMTDRSRA